MSYKYHYRAPHPNYHRLLLATPHPATYLSQNKKDLIDLRQFQLPPRDQGQEGCCSGFSTAAVREGLRSAANGDCERTRYLSPAYLYARTRLAEGTFPRDVGATVADEVDTLFHYGSCPEEMLKYSADPKQGEPTRELDVAANAFAGLVPQRVMLDIVAIENVLAALQPIVFGTTVFESFEKIGVDGMMPVPGPKEKALGGHAMVCVGYDRKKKVLIIRNSWSARWADKGYCYMPYALIARWFEAWTLSMPAPDSVESKK